MYEQQRIKNAEVAPIHLRNTARNNLLESRGIAPAQLVNLRTEQRLGLLQTSGPRTATPPRYYLNRPFLHFDLFFYELSVNLRVDLPSERASARYAVMAPMPIQKKG